MAATVLTRGTIIEMLTEALAPLDYVTGFWEGGAAASHRLDPWSDIDLYVVVDDGKVPEAFGAIETALRGLSPIRLKYEVPHPPESGIAQAFYRLERASEFLLVDLAILKQSAPDKYLERELHGEAVFYINRDGALTIPPLDAEPFAAKLLERKERLRARLEIFGPFVEKEIHRGNWLEVLDLYRVLVLGSLIEILRMRHRPAHYAFGIRYVHSELPADSVQRLERLAFVRDADDLRAKIPEALRWFREAIEQVRETEIRERLRSQVDAPAGAN